MNGRHKLAGAALLDRNISRTVEILFSYGTEGIELDRLAPSFEAVLNAKTKGWRIFNLFLSQIMKDLKNLIGYLGRVLETKDLETPGQGNEEGDWIAAYTKLIGHRWGIGRAAVLSDVMNMAGFNRV